MGVSRIGDQTTGHGGFPSEPITSGSSNVLINGIGAARIGDSLTGHSDGDSFHGSSISGGSGSVNVNGMSIARAGDSVSCGDTISGCSSNVNAG